jgi:hypothetical protein
MPIDSLGSSQETSDAEPEGLVRRFGVAARLTLGASLVLAIALFVGGALFSAALSNTNRGQLFEAGRERVNALVSIVEQGAVPVTLPSPRDSLLFAQVIGVDGKIAGSTQNVRDMELIAPPSSWKFADTSITTSKATVDKAGCELFVRSVPVTQPAPGRPVGTYYVLVATPVRQSDEMQAALQCLLERRCCSTSWPAVRYVRLIDSVVKSMNSPPTISRNE